MGPCLFCSVLVESKLVLSNEGDENKPRKKFRLCIATKKLITPDSNGCSDFELAETFYCQKNNIWIGNKACINRFRHHAEFEDWESCKRCSTAQELIELKKEIDFTTRTFKRVQLDL
jgi:hypothetical protein